MIDVFFVQVRPSPWRQAVDLANMMLVLAVRTDAERVYERALHYFTPDEIAEAFAAARGVASPTQLRTVMKKDPRDLLRTVPRAGAGTTPDLAPAVEREARSSSRSHWSSLPCWSSRSSRSFLSPADYRETRGRCQLRNEQRDDPHGAGGAVGDVGAMCRVPPDRLEAGRHAHRTRAREFWLDSDRAGTDAVAVTLLPRGECR